MSEKWSSQGVKSEKSLTFGAYLEQQEDLFEFVSYIENPEYKEQSWIYREKYYRENGQFLRCKFLVGIRINGVCKDYWFRNPEKIELEIITEEAHYMAKVRKYEAHYQTAGLFSTMDMRLFSKND